jgi:large subunit ribosomal protein L40
MLFFRLGAPLHPQRPLLNSSTSTIRNASSRRSEGDPKLEIIRRTLYPPNVRNKPSPTGSWRPNTLRALRKAIPSIQAHEIIERAFKLHIRHKRQHRQAELERKFESMRNAMIELDKVNPRLAHEANQTDDPRIRTEAEVALLKTLRGTERLAVEGRIRGLFPREMRIPTDTPPKSGWNHDWKPPTARII